MPTISIRLDPRRMQNPDLDIRYFLPDLIAEKSSGLVADNGYDYVGDVPYLLIFLKTEDIERGLDWVVDSVENERILGNDLREAAVIAVERGGTIVVKYPVDFIGALPA